MLAQNDSYCYPKRQRYEESLKGVSGVDNWECHYLTATNSSSSSHLHDSSTNRPTTKSPLKYFSTLWNREIVSLSLAKMSPTIKPVTKEHEAQWRTLWGLYNEFYKRTISEEVTATTFSRFLDPNVQMFCAVATETPSEGGDEVVIGFATWYPHQSTSQINGTVYLNDLFVNPDVRSKGIGGKLIDHVYEHAKDVLGVESVYWHTQHFNHRAQLLYVKKATKTDFVQYAKKF